MADPFKLELLCERCGYSIEGLPHEAACPECSRPIRTSLPEARVGSAWQRQPGFRSWLATLHFACRSPFRFARSLRIERERSRQLRRLNLRLAAFLFTLLPAGIYGVQLMRGEAPYALRDLTWPWAESALRLVLLAVALGATWIGTVLLLSLLTSVEARGVRLFGRVHKSRVTESVADAITGHATYGWLIAGLLASAGFALGLAMHEHAMHENVGDLRGLFMLSPILLPLLGAFVGLLCFETAVYIGVLNCRFANHHRETTESGSADDPSAG